MKTLVVYYSNKGSNKYLAQKISKSLSCDIEEIKPRINNFTLFLMNIHAGIKPLKSNIGEYDKVILCGPIWVGKFIPPLRSFIKKYKDSISKLVFVTCCGSTYENKDKKFGHGLVFKEVESMLDGKCVLCQAFPVGLVLSEDQQEEPETVMKTRINDDNFKDEIQDIYDEFIQKVNQITE